MSQVQKDIKQYILSRYDYISKMDILKELKDMYGIKDISAAYDSIDWDDIN